MRLAPHAVALISLASLLGTWACRERATAPAPAASTAASHEPSLEPTGTEPSPAPRPPLLYDVAFVAPNDVLNVRTAPDPGAPIAGTLPPSARGVTATGAEQLAGAQRWIEVEAGATRGWVNASFLTVAVTAEAFAADPRPVALLDALARTLATRGDLSALTGPRGLWVHHYGTVARYSTAELSSLARSAEERRWNGPACGDPCLTGTFAALVGEPLRATLSKPDRPLERDRALRGGNASAVLPAELANLHFISVMDRGTPAVDHLDWRAFTLYFEYVEAGRPGGAGAARGPEAPAAEPKLLAIVPDAWSP